MMCFGSSNRAEHTSMPTLDDIEQQRELLRYHRMTLTHYLGQRAIAGPVNERPELASPTGRINDPGQALVMALATAMIGVAVAYHQYRSRNREMRIFDDRLEFNEGSKTRRIVWNEVATEWRTVNPRASSGAQRYGPRISGYRVNDDHVVVISVGDDLVGWQEIEHQIEMQTLPHLLRRYRAEYRSVGRLDFGGGLRISRAGVDLGSTTIPWPVGVDNQRVAVVSGGRKRVYRTRCACASRRGVVHQQNACSLRGAVLEPHRQRRRRCRFSARNGLSARHGR